MINIAICDDEKYILDKIKKLVFDFFHRKNVEITVSQFGSGEELLRHNKNIDILFLDIQMDGIDGMETMERLFSAMQNAKDASLLVQKGYESNIIVFDDIVFCEIIDRKIYLHLKTEEVIDYYDRIENLETKLDGRFFKCHRSYLINLSHLKSYKNGMAYMINDKQIPVSRLRSKEFSSVVLKYMKERRV